MAGRNTTHPVIGSPVHMHSVCVCFSFLIPTQLCDPLSQAENVIGSPCFTSSVYQLERLWMLPRINPTVKTTVYAVLWWSNVDYFLFSVFVLSANTNSSSLSCVVNIDTHRRMGSTVTWPFSGAISSHSLSCLSAVLRVTTSTTCRVKTSSRSGAVRVVLGQRQYCLCLGGVRERSCTILLPPGHGSENLGPAWRKSQATASSELTHLSTFELADNVTTSVRLYLPFAWRSGGNETATGTKIAGRCLFVNNTTISPRAFPSNTTSPLFPLFLSRTLLTHFSNNLQENNTCCCQYTLRVTTRTWPQTSC